MIVEKGKEIDRAELADLVESWYDDTEKGDVITVPVRSVLKCEAPTGICQACYGRSLATGKMAQIGDAVGIIAAQSIGEPGTQLTMRTFHTGGVAGADITHGLPRVVELFEARKPKGLAKIAEVGGKVSIEESDKAVTVVITDDTGEEHRHTFPRRTRLFVDEGEKIEPGTQLNEGSLYPAELLAVRGRTETEVYLVREVQEVYKSQGVDIDDKHIELIVRQMMKRVRVDQKGDTDLLPGQFVDRQEYGRVNKAVIDAGGEAAQAEEIILGITKASLNTDSFLSAASFQETTKVLTDAALEGKIDRLVGLKENVIIGKLIPAATGPEALPPDRDRARRAAAARDGRRRSARPRRPGGRARADRRRRPDRFGGSRSPTSPTWRASATAAPRSGSSTSSPSSTSHDVGRRRLTRIRRRRSHLSRRSRIVGFGSAALVLAGAVCAALVGGEFGEILALVLIEPGVRRRDQPGVPRGGAQRGPRAGPRGRGPSTRARAIRESRPRPRLGRRRLDRMRGRPRRLP